MKNQTTIKYLIPVFISFYVTGFVDIIGVATGYVKEDFQLSDSVAQLLPSLVFIWFALMSIPTGIFQDRKGKRNTVNLGMIITAIGVIIPFISYSFTTAVIGFMILGIGNTILQVSANPLLLDISPKESKAANLSLSQFIKAIASMLGPIITAGLARYTGDWKLIFPLYAVISILSALWLNSVKIEESKPEKPPATLKTVISLFKSRFVIIMILAIFFIVGFDVAMNTNIANFLKQRYNIDLDYASLGISVYFASLMVGRLVGAILLRKVDANKFLVISTVLTIIGLFGIIFFPNLYVSLSMIFVAGLGFSNVFPLLFTITVERRPEYTNEISGLIIFGLSGGAVIPPIAGVLTDLFGVVASIWVLMACVLYVAFATYYIIKK